MDNWRSSVVAGKMIYDAVTDDGSYSYSDREEREREAIEGAKQKENKKILIDINSFKKQRYYIYMKSMDIPFILIIQKVLVKKLHSNT